MSISKLNPLKTRIFKFFTSSFQNSKRIKQIENLPKDSEVKVLIARPNHRLGNQLLLTPLIQEVKKQFPNCKIHLVVNGNISPILFSKDQNVVNVINLPKKPFNHLFKYVKCWILIKRKHYDSLRTL